MSSEAKQAFDRLWSLQSREGKAKGAWPWFDLDLDPWETPDSAFYGAALAALAAGAAPSQYRERPEIRERLVDLTEYLQREHQAQPLHNRLTLLWASSKLPAALPLSMIPWRRAADLRTTTLAEAGGRREARTATRTTTWHCYTP